MPARAHPPAVAAAAAGAVPGVVSGVRTLVLDFDGTLTLGDIGDLICGRFATPAWADIDAAWVRGELSLAEAQRQMWALCRCTAGQALEHAREVGHLRPGLDDLLAAAAAKHVPVWLASGGFDFYIEEILGPTRLLGLGRRYYNQARFAGDRVQVSFPHEDLSCRRCAVCKGRVCGLAAAAGGGPVAFVGDGTSDRCVLDHAAPGTTAAIFAVAGGPLEAEAAALGAAVVPFTDLSEVARRLF